MSLLAVVLFAVAVTAQPYQNPEDCEDNGPARVKFAQLRSMEDEELDLTPYLDVPLDYEVGRAKPMTPPKPIDSGCPEGTDCGKGTKSTPVPPKVLVNFKPFTPSPSPSGAPSASPKPNHEYANDPSSGPKDWYPSLHIPDPPRVYTEEKPRPTPTPDPTPAPTPTPTPDPVAPYEPETQGTVAEDEPDLEDEKMEPESEPQPPVSEPMPPGVQIAERVDGSVIAQVMEKQKEDAYNEAVEIARRKAIDAMSPSPSPVAVDDEEVELPPLPDIGLGPTLDAGPGVPPPAPKPSNPPSKSPSPTPSASLELYFPTIETEVEDCSEAPRLPPLSSNDDDDIVSGQYPIADMHGQYLPHTPIVRPGQVLVVPAPQDFEVLPDLSQEYHADPKSVSPLTPSYHDDAMLDVSKYQTFSLSDKYDPVPGHHTALRSPSLAGDDMGTYIPSLKKLDYIRSSASHLAGKILRRESPLHDTDSPEEYRSNELASNVTWALMNQPTFPQASRNYSFPANLTSTNYSSRIAALIPGKHAYSATNDNVNNVNNAYNDKFQMESTQSSYQISSSPHLTDVHAPEYSGSSADPHTGSHADHSAHDSVPGYADHVAHDNVPGLSDPSLLSVVPQQPELSGPSLTSVTPQHHETGTGPNLVVDENLDSTSDGLPSVPRYQLESDGVAAVGQITPSDIENRVPHNMPEPHGEIYEEYPFSDVPQVPTSNKGTQLGDSTEAVRIGGVSTPLGPGSTMPSFKGLDLGGMDEAVACQNSTDTSESAVEVATMTPEFACAARVGCGECVMDSACVWCPSMNSCVEGGAEGPFSVTTCQDYLFEICHSTTFALRPMPISRAEAYVDHEAHWHKKNE